jgi:DnaK suppressor protein
MPTLSSATADELRKRLNAARDDIVGQVRARLDGSEEPAAVSLLAHLGQPDDVSQAVTIRDDEMALLGQEQSQLHAMRILIGTATDSYANTDTRSCVKVASRS